VFVTTAPRSSRSPRGLPISGDIGYFSQRLARAFLPAFPRRPRVTVPQVSSGRRPDAAVYGEDGGHSITLVAEPTERSSCDRGVLGKVFSSPSTLPNRVVPGAGPVFQPAPPGRAGTA